SEVIYAGSGEGLQRPDLSTGDGVYRSLDGGETWKRILYRDENTGAADVQIDPANPAIVYASLWEAREGPWENAAWNGPGGGIFKSTDGGATWKQLGGGLPAVIVQANLAIAPSSPKTLIATLATPGASQLYRSDDAGEHWSLATTDARPAIRIGGGDLPVVRFDPKNANVLYSASVVCWKSTDGGKAWIGWRGAPGGDDYQNMWISPNDSNVVALASDQGAIVTVNGGATWGSWYNQSTAQLYHVSADNSFPYRLYSGQQESGSVGIESRGPNGQITFRDWHPVGAEEYGYVVADPLNPEIVYGGKLSRYDRRTHQAQDVTPQAFRTDDFRVIRTEPVVLSSVDPHLLFFAANTLWQTRDGGQHWKQASPDLTRKTYEIPASVGKFRDEPTAQPKQRGVIYALAPSPLDVKRIWAGTDDGLIHVTTDGGKNWRDVTPPQLSAWWKVSVMDASHFEAPSAYAAVNTIRLDDLRPHIYRTHDDGKTWQEIVQGLPVDENVNAVREDPKRRGLLFAATERGVYYSLDDGDHWQSLRLNLPAVSVRDVIVKDDDLCIATHGRGFWILDDLTPLRRLQPNESGAQLFQPATALRVRWNSNTDTPLPPDEPAGENPPEGAALSYSLGTETSGPVTLEIKDASGKAVRRYASTDPVPKVDEKLKIPRYWVKPPTVLPATPGLHRFFWNLHGAPLPEAEAEYPMTAIPRETAPQPTAPWAVPGSYTVSLTTGGKTLTQPLQVKIDPRVQASAADLAQQFQLSQALYELRRQLLPIGKEYGKLLTKVDELKTVTTDKSALEKIETLHSKLAAFANPAAVRSGQPLEFDLLSKTAKLFGDLQQVDAAPTPEQTAAATGLQKDAPAIEERWKSIPEEVARLSAELAKTGAAPIKRP
ncbi:MAG: WD40/YVTN/BNR-like repeat-containing protein, partial [Chthoniobacterales bacterium]